MHSQNTRYLDEPPDVVGINFIGNGPLGQFVPFVSAFTVNRQTEFGVLILRFFQVGRHFVDDSGKILTADVIVRFQERLSQTGFADRIVFRVEFIEPVERVPIL